MIIYSRITGSYKTSNGKEDMRENWDEYFEDPCNVDIEDHATISVCCLNVLQGILILTI